MRKEYKSGIARKIDNYNFSKIVVKSANISDFNCMISATAYGQFLIPSFNADLNALQARLDKLEKDQQFGADNEKQIENCRDSIKKLVDSNRNPALFYQDKHGEIEVGDNLLLNASDEIKRECRLIAADATNMIGVLWNVGTIKEIRSAADRYRAEKYREKGKQSTDEITALIRDAFKAYDRKDKDFLRSFETSLRTREQLVIADYLINTDPDSGKKLDWKDLSDNTIARRLCKLLVFKHLGGKITADEVKNA